MQSADPQIARTDETRELEEEFPRLVWVAEHHQENSGHEPVVAHVISS